MASVASPPAAIRLPRALAPILAVVVAVSAVGLLAPLVIYSNTIDAVSNIVE